MHRQGFVGLVAAVVFASLPAASHAQSITTLTGTVGPAHTIALRTVRGALVGNLQAGKYKIVVRDRSPIHNFHLFGGGLNKSTGVAFRGTVTWNVTLKNGKVYTYRCDPHRSTMRRTFGVGRTASPPSPVPPVAPPPTTPPPGGYDPSPYP
jgi:hypothetical protein